MNTTLLIMAAGIGSRFGTGIKQLEPVDDAGHIIMDYSIHDAIEAGFNHVVFIIRKDIEKEFKEVIGDRIASICSSHNVTVDYAFQDINDIPGTLPEGRTKPWGTGQAVLAAKDVIKTPFIVINADDYYGKEGFKAVHEYLVNGGKSCMAGFVLKNTLSDNGGVTRGICKMDEQNNLTEVVETKNIVKIADGAEADGVSVDVDSLVSMNMWGLTPDFLTTLEEGFKEFFEKEVPSNPQKAEYLIPIFIGELLEQGKMSVKVLKTNDTWYGMTSYAEFQRVYYNKDLFAKYGLEIPTTYDEFVDVCQKFVDAGVTPIAADAQEYGVMWLWWQLVSKEADAKFIDNWQLYKGDVDWNSKILTNSVSTINDWLDKGFISHNATGMKAEDTTQAFIKGEYPIYQTGTWNQGRFVKQITTFDWDAAVMPESNFAIGCAGNLLVIPERSHHKDLAAKFIDYVLSDDVQNYLGNAGGIPVAGDASKINDEKSKAMIEEYASYANDGKLSYYPDYAASNLTDAVPAEFQELVNGTKKPADVLKGIHEKYDVGVEDMGVKTN